MPHSVREHACSLGCFNRGAKHSLSRSLLSSSLGS